MHQNCSQHHSISSNQEPPFFNLLQKQHLTNIPSPNNIIFSSDISNHSQDKSNKLPTPTLPETNQKDHKPQDIYQPLRKASMEQDNISEKHSDYDKKSEPIKHVSKNLIRSQKNISVKCWNKLCLSKGIKRVKSKVLGRYLWLCQSCTNSYNLEQYCEFCQQIYAHEEVDGLEWIECEAHGCGRWNHTTCQQQYSSFMKQNCYYCTSCRSNHTIKPKNLSNVGSKSQSSVSMFSNRITTKNQTENNSIQKIKIFSSVVEKFGALESMLTSYSYKLSVSEDQLRQDSVLLDGKDSCNNDYAKPVKRSKYKR